MRRRDGGGTADRARVLRPAGHGRTGQEPARWEPPACVRRHIRHRLVCRGTLSAVTRTSGVPGARGLRQPLVQLMGPEPRPCSLSGPRPGRWGPPPSGPGRRDSTFTPPPVSWDGYTTSVTWSSSSLVTDTGVPAGLQRGDADLGRGLPCPPHEEVLCEPVTETLMEHEGITSADGDLVAVADCGQDDLPDAEVPGSMGTSRGGRQRRVLPFPGVSAAQVEQQSRPRLREPSGVQEPAGVIEGAVAEYCLRTPPAGHRRRQGRRCGPAGTSRR